MPRCGPRGGRKAAYQFEATPRFREELSSQSSGHATLKSNAVSFLLMVIKLSFSCQACGMCFPNI